MGERSRVVGLEEEGTNSQSSCLETWLLANRTTDTRIFRDEVRFSEARGRNETNWRVQLLELSSLEESE